MSSSLRCVAGLDIHAQKIVRPLLTPGSNWQIGSDRSVFEVGHLLNVSPTGASGKTFPHATEDFPLSKTPKLLERFDEETTYKLVIGGCIGSVKEAFGAVLTDDHYVVAGTRCPSLVGIAVPRKRIAFHTGYGGRLRVTFTDSAGTDFDLPVTSDRLLGLFDRAKTASAPFGVVEVNTWLKENGPTQRLILRVGLARAWDGGDKNWNPLRCYLQLNGIICPDDHYHVLPYDDEE